MSQTCRGVHWTPALMILFAYSHNFWCDENCVFSFARNACNRVRCTRTGEHGSTLHYFGNCISFIRFIFIINFLLSRAGVQWTPLLDCESNYNATLGHNMFFYITNCFHEQGTAARRAGVQWTPLQNCANNCNVTLGQNMFLILQTAYTNWERRLAVARL